MLEDIAHHAYDSILRKGGITVNLQGVEPTEGYAYSPFPELEKVLPQSAVTPDVVAQYITDNQTALSMPGNYLGAWLDAQSGNVFLDVSHVGPPTADTVSEAAKQNQVAVFDLANFNEIPTGVTRDSVTSAVDHQAVLNQNMGQDLQGLPGPVNVPGYGPLHFHSNADIQRIANEYNHANGLGAHPVDYQKVDPNRAAQIAQEYERMPHNPNDPQVAQAYDALARETRAQYDHAVNNGYRFEFYPQHDPYPNSPREAVLDLHHNKHMFVYPTDTGYGSGNEGWDTSDHPLLGDSGIRWNGRPVTHNDLFRAIHDFYGHAKEGVGFRADGEDNAYRQHAAMFSPEARRALTSETRGQNSWVNFGPHGEHNQTATSDTIYAPQKAGLMPDWTGRTSSFKHSEHEYDREHDPEHVSNLANSLKVYHGTLGAGAQQSLGDHRPVMYDLKNHALFVGQPGALHHHLRTEFGSGYAPLPNPNGYKFLEGLPDASFEHGVLSPANQIHWYSTFPHEEPYPGRSHYAEANAINQRMGWTSGEGDIPDACPDCQGTGADYDESGGYYHDAQHACARCEGTGRIRPDADWSSMFSKVAWQWDEKPPEFEFPPKFVTTDNDHRQSIRAGYIVEPHEPSEWQWTSKVDPDWMRQWIATNGPYLAHYTDNATYKPIMQQGLLPHDTEGIGSKYQDELTPRADHVYLRYPFALNHSLHQTPIHVDLRKLDWDRINADEDQIAESPAIDRFGFSMPKPFYDDSGNYAGVSDDFGVYKHYGDWADQHQMNEPHHTAHSLNGGTVAVRGGINPEAFVPQEEVDAYIKANHPDRIKPFSPGRPADLKHKPVPYAPQPANEQMALSYTREGNTRLKATNMNDDGWHFSIWELPQGYGLLNGPQYPEEFNLVSDPGRQEGYETCPNCHALTKMPLGGCPHCGFNKDEWSERMSKAWLRAPRQGYWQWP
jgi:hypothetical protein